MNNCSKISYRIFLCDSIMCSQIGKHCEENINECLHPIDHCYSHGKCVDGIDSFSCICDAGYTGRRCNTQINECQPESPCQNGGTCLDRINKYVVPVVLYPVSYD